MAVNATGVTLAWYQPVTGYSQARFTNLGLSNLYLGTFDQLSVTATQGLVLAPGRVVSLAFPPTVSQTVYVSGGWNAGTAAATLGTGTGLATVGTTKLTVTTMNVNYAAGTALLLGQGTNTEVVVVASTASTVITTVNPTLLYHPVGDVMTAATAVLGQLQVTSGVL